MLFKNFFIYEPDLHLNALCIRAINLVPKDSDEQMSMFDDTFALQSRMMTSMVNARIRIALEFCVQRSWLDIRDTDYAADLVTAAVIRKISSVLSEDAEWETDRLSDGLITLFS